MKLEKEQRTQFIVLCALFVVVIGFGAFRIMGTGTSANSPTTPAASAEKPAPAKAAPAEQAAAEATPAQDLAKAMGFVLPVKDPFAPQVSPETESKAATSTSSPPRKAPVIVRESNMPFPIMPAFDSNPGPVDIAPTPVVEQVDPSKDYKLTGVIEGDSSVAIIRGPEDSRHIIREGQSLDGKFVIRSISRAGVRLSHNGRSYFLPISSGKDS